MPQDDVTLSVPDLLARIGALDAELQEARETLEAIHGGRVDAVVINETSGEHRVYTLETADRPYRFLIEHMQEGAATLTEDGVVLYCNPRVAAILGVPDELVIGRDLRGHVLAVDAGVFADLLIRAGAGGVRGEVTFRRDDGSETPVLVSLSPLRDGDTLLIAAILTDLSDQKQRLRQIAEANERLLTEIAERERTEEALRQSQKMQAIGQLTGGIAHDFNNMLQAIATSVELATQRISAGRGQEAPRFLDTARQSIDRAAALTHSLLAFSRRQAQAARQVDVVALLRKTSSLIRQTVGPEIALDLQLGDASWPVRCDPNQLENALLNLAINARDAMLPAGGRLLIRTGGEMLAERDLVGWESAHPGDFVRITVSDTGTGMSPETLAHVFEPFFTTKPDGAGTGLGLSQVYGFVAQSGGLIRLESEVGRGTAAHLFLPRDHGATEGEERRATRRESVPAAMARVLLVDDESDVRRLFAEALREAGHVVIEAETGSRALEVVRRAAGSLDILVTDVGLPGGMNGRQLAEAVRQARPDMPVLLITGYAGDALSAQQGLAQDIRTLRKPFGLEALAAHVRSMLAGGQPAG